MADISDDDRGLVLDGSDPDAQATVTDYIDYTEFLPADLIRSLTLIRGLDERYLQAAQDVHELTKTFGRLPDLAADDRPSAQSLRGDISTQLDRALTARESAYAEACRLYDVVDHHFNRLDCIKKKLDAFPKPTKEPTPPSSAKRARDKKGEGGPTRLTLRLDKDKAAGRSRRSGAAYNADDAMASTEHSDAEGDSKVALTPKRNDKMARTARASMAAAAPSPVADKPPVHPPPKDAKPGGPDMPWLRLSDWEMNQLRKKMKKNAAWQPSDVMVHRELAVRGRGWEAYRSAKTRADRKGEELLDCDNIANTPKRKETARKSANEVKASLEHNRGLELNAARRIKRETRAEEKALAEAEPELAEQEGKSTRANQKRKREESSAVQEASNLRGSTKRQKPTTTARDTKKSPSLSPPTGLKQFSTRAASTAAAKHPTPPLPGPTGRRRSATGLTERPSAISRDLRRKSATPARRTPIPEPGRRNKRPAPGPVSSSQDGGAALSFGRRKSKPAKKKAVAKESAAAQEGIRIDADGVWEEIDPNEPRYCVCGDVSFGTMICCENNDVCPRPFVSFLEFC